MVVPRVGQTELVGIDDSRADTVLVATYETTDVPRTPTEVFYAKLGAFMHGAVERLDAEPSVPRLDTQHDMGAVAVGHMPEALPLAG